MLLFKLSNRYGKVSKRAPCSRNVRIIAPCVNDVNLALELVRLSMNVRKMKKENTLLKQSPRGNQLFRYTTWNGFRNDTVFGAGSDDSETPTTPTDEGRSQSSDDLQPSPAVTTERTLDGILQGVERYHIASRPPSPSSDCAQELNQSQITQAERSMMSSAGSYSLQEPTAMTDSYLAGLPGNRMDLIFAADSQKTYAPGSSHPLTRRGHL
jgi:hypothetical protein